MRTIVANIEWVYGTTSELGSTNSTWTVEIAGHVVIRSQSSVSDVKTACGRRMRKSCRKALVKFDELVMLMTIEKPKDKGKVNANTIMLDLVDRSDEVVVGTTDRVVKARIVYRAPKEQRDGARDAKSTRSISWQHTSAGTAGGELVNAACVASVRLTATVMEPRRQSSLVLYQARSGTRKVWIFQGLRGMSCGSVGRRGVETSWREVLRAHQSGCDVRRRGPAKTAYGGGATRASSIGRKSRGSSGGPGIACKG